MENSFLPHLGGLFFGQGTKICSHGAFLLGISAWTRNKNLGSRRGSLRLTKVLARAETTLASAASGPNASSSKTPATPVNESCPRTARLSMEFSSGPLQILGGEKFVALNAIACTEPGLRLVSVGWIGQISVVKGQAGNGNADREARSSISSRADDSRPGLFLSGQRLFEALPSFGIETKDLALFELQKSSFW